MSANHALPVLVIAIIVILAAGCTLPAPEKPQISDTPALNVTVPSGPVPEKPQVSGSSALNLTVPSAPVPVASAEGVNIAYELELVPAAGQVPGIEKIEVIEPATGAVLFEADGILLEKYLYHPASVPLPSPAELRNESFSILRPRISLWFTTSPGAVPDRLVHRITLNRTAEGQPPAIITGGGVAVRKDLAPVLIGAPLSGAGWLAIATTVPTTHHFRTQVTAGGITRVPQRFAQDWVLLDPVTWQAVKGNATLARNYYGFGKEIYAVADGKVVGVSDGLPDHAMIYSSGPFNFSTGAGNHVIIDIGNRKYACYGHMVNGSIRVRPGDIVKEGQVIGQVGNSGASDLPHLHFQVVSDIPSFLGAEGYPHVYRSFDALGGINLTRTAEKEALPGSTPGRLWSEVGDSAVLFDAPIPRQKVLPENYEIVRFPPQYPVSWGFGDWIDDPDEGAAEGTGLLPAR